jgi:hypothetical protein
MMQGRALSSTLRAGWSGHAAATLRGAPAICSNAAARNDVTAPRRWKTSQDESKMAEKMRDELAEVIKKKPLQPIKESKYIGHGFVQFMKANKTQFLNIGASFFCVLLAYQIVALRRSGRYRQKQLDEQKQELLEKQEILRSLTTDEFVTRMAKECAAMVLLEEDAKSKWSIRKRQLSADELAEKLHPVIDLLLNEQIGDAGLTEEQKKERTVEALRNAQVSQTKIDVAEVIDIVEDSSGQKVVQKRVFSI